MRISLEEIVAYEQLGLGKPCRAITSHCAVFRDHDGIERECWFVAYDASDGKQGQTRWTVYADAQQQASGIISVSSRAAASVPK